MSAVQQCAPLLKLIAGPKVMSELIENLLAVASWWSPPSLGAS